jgi:hypothetical protein
MQCPYYGRHATANLKLLIDSHGNQCALIVERFAPCYLAVDGQAPELEACKFHGTGRELEIRMYTQPCPDCDAAKRHAWSDATTPGFFRPFCLKHDPERQPK